MALILAAGPPALAESVTVDGAFGASGQPGEVGSPGLPGTSGQDAETAVAVADALDENNRATARGGVGGRGGAGGRAETGSGTNGGDGGNSGRGGDAIAIATTTRANEVDAIATGGTGGPVGAGGRGDSPGVSGSPGMLGGNGGDATATAEILTELGSEAPFFRQEGFAIASGGRGSDTGASGGDAQATMIGTVTGGNTSQSATHRLSAIAVGGSAGFQEEGGVEARGGNAIAEVSATTTHGTLIVVADADGGQGPSRARGTTPGRTGDATAIASGVHSGTGSLVVRALANPGGGENPGTARATASGIATNGADVTVEAAISDGSGSEFRDAVSGSTSGTLELIQTVRSDLSGSEPLGVNNSASLVASNPGGGDLIVRVTAGGGIGRVEGGDGGDGIIQNVDVTGDRDVTVIGTAIGGQGGRSFSEEIAAGTGGEARVGSLMGRSTANGAVLVEATARSGQGGPFRPGGRFVSIGNGGSAVLDNAVDGETSGELTLRQIAIAGNGTVPQGASSSPEEASSRLDRTRSAERFSIRSEAVGALAEAFGSATNTSGDVSVEVVARGTPGAGPIGIDGGVARATAFGATRLDDRDVMVGADTLVNATGGVGKKFHLDFEEVGDGGAAISNSTGVAEGDSRVFVWDRAVGGAGGGDFVGSFPRPADHVGANGGTATSRANASNSGAADVVADARAVGGAGGNARGEDQLSGRGGNASASARGESSGAADVIVRAVASGGRGGYRRLGSLAGRGGDASVTDLSGSTAGQLTLEAVAVGGRGGAESNTRSTSFGRGGDAQIALDATNDGGGDLVINAVARASRGGRVTLGTIRGTSSSGAEVSVFATVDQAFDRFGPPVPDYDPSQVLSYIDAVTGETSGILRLRQDVDGGGEGGLVENEVNDIGDRVGTAVETNTLARDGADAIARSTATNTQGWATADADARSDSGRRAIAEVDVQGAGDVDSVATASSRISASDGAELSRSTARAATAGDADVFATAQSNADGGADSIARADGRGDGIGDVTVNASATTSGAGGGQLEATARGVSEAAGNVSVSATVRRAEVSSSVAETIMRDAVSGSTAGELSLRQNVLSVNGDVRTSLRAQNEGGGALGVTLFASAGSAVGGDAILGDIIGESSSGSDVQIDVNASGNAIRMESLDDPSRVSEIRGSSNGGDVSVRAGFGVAGGSGTTTSPTEIRGADGRSLSMENVVGGETSGRLTLIQDASGGRGADVSIPFFGRDLAGFGGRGGDALNRLEKFATTESLRLEGTANGGRGGNLSRAQQGTAGRGGDGELSLLGTNKRGTVEVLGTARGGVGGRSEIGSGDGGAATAEFVAKSMGDDQMVVVGRDPMTSVEDFGAMGGAGGTVTRSFGFPRPTETRAGAGGSATSRSEGRALGDSRVEVFDQALGGVGGLGTSSSFSPRLASGGQGGDATSLAIAHGAGQSRVVGRANAYGGSGGDRLLTGGRGGNADAVVRARGKGEVQASALAVGGNGTTEQAMAGSAYSRLEAFGASGSGMADARTGTGSLGRLRVAVTRDIRGSTVIEASATMGLPVPDLPKEAGASAFLSGGLNSDEFLAATKVNGSLEALLTERPGSIVKALGQWQGRGTAVGDTVQITELDITLARPDPGADLMLAVFDLQAVGGGFDELSFRLEVFGEQFGEAVVFGDIESARAFFASTIVLGDAYLDEFDLGNAPAVRAIFEVSMSAKQAISVSIAAVVVPEPSTAILLGLGLLVIARKRSTSHLGDH